MSARLAFNCASWECRWAYWRCLAVDIDVEPDPELAVVVCGWLKVCVAVLLYGVEEPVGRIEVLYVGWESVRRWGFRGGIVLIFVVGLFCE